MGMLLRRHYPTDAPDYSELGVKQLKDLAKEKGVKGYSALDKDALIEALKE